MARPLEYIALCNISITSFTFIFLYLSFNNFITHLVANINFLCQLIAKGTPSTLPPILYGNKRTLGVILINEKKKIKLGSILSFCFNSYLILLKKLNAHNFLPL
jgi:hypothetical protein